MNSHKEILTLLKEVAITSFLNEEQKKLIFEMALNSEQPPEKIIALIQKTLETKSAKAIREIIGFKR